MSNPLTSILKGIQFLSNIFTKTATYAEAFAKAGPSMLAAVLAVVYDVMQTANSAKAQLADVAALDFNGAVQLTPHTVGLLEKVFADFHAGEQSVVDAFKNLNLPAPASPAVTPKAAS